MSRITSLNIMLLVGFLVVGCEEDSSEGESTEFSPTSVPEETPVQDLNEEEESAVCEETEAWVTDNLADTVKQIFCANAGIEAGLSTTQDFDQDACRAAEADCLVEPLPDEDDLLDETLECELSATESCEATVGEYADCVNEAAALLEEVAASTTCEKFAAGEFPDEESLALSAECEALLDQCAG